MSNALTDSKQLAGNLRILELTMWGWRGHAGVARASYPRMSFERYDEREYNEKDDAPDLG